MLEPSWGFTERKISIDWSQSQQFLLPYDSDSTVFKKTVALTFFAHFPSPTSSSSMAFSATFSAPPSPSFSLSYKMGRSLYSPTVNLLKPLKIRASATVDYSNVSVSDKPSPLKVWLCHCLLLSYSFYLLVESLNFFG